MKDKKLVRIFLAEDNLGDVWLLEEALKNQSIEYELEHYTTAEDAINGATAAGSGNALLPDLMLVDFNLPRGDARDILTAAQANPKLALVPKVVMSSFLRPDEMDQAILLGAHCFVPKPAGLDEFLSTMGKKLAEVLNTSACECVDKSV